MDNSNDVSMELPGFIRCYKSGHVERLAGTAVVPPGFDVATSVTSKDVVIDAATNLSARLYLPSSAAAAAAATGNQKLPVLFYVHGGGFCVESAFSPSYHPFLNDLTSKANTITVSVEYRLAPEHPLPAAYDDCAAALQWVLSENNDPWIVQHGNLEKVFFAGDSAGANIVHNLAKEIGEKGMKKIKGMVLLHPFFWGSKMLGSEDEALHMSTERVWKFICPSSTGVDDHRLNPLADGAPPLDRLACEKVLVFVGEKDFLKERGKEYYEKLAAPASKWRGAAELVESAGEGHVFFLFNPESQKSKELMTRLVEFFNSD